MPLINGRFYTNPAHGRGLERARLREEGAENDEPEVVSAAKADGRWVTIDHRHILITKLLTITRTIHLMRETRRTSTAALASRKLRSGTLAIRRCPIRRATQRAIYSCSGPSPNRVRRNRS